MEGEIVQYLGEDELRSPENVLNDLLNDTKDIAKYSNFGEIRLCSITYIEIILINDRLWKGKFVRSKGKVPSNIYLGQLINLYTNLWKTLI